MGNSCSQFSYQKLVEQRPTFPMDYLPRKPQFQILSYLKPKDLLHCRLVSHSWKCATDHYLDNNVPSFFQDHINLNMPEDIDEAVSFLRKNVPATLLESKDEVKTFLKDMGPLTKNPFPFRTLVLAIWDEEYFCPRWFRGFDEKFADIMQEFLERFGNEVRSCFVFCDCANIPFAAAFNMPNLTSLALHHFHWSRFKTGRPLKPKCDSGGGNDFQHLARLSELQLFGSAGLRILQEFFYRKGYGTQLRNVALCCAWVAVDFYGGSLTLAKLLPNLEMLCVVGGVETVISVLTWVKGKGEHPFAIPEKLRTLSIDLRTIRPVTGYDAIQDKIFDLFKALDRRNLDSVESLHINTGFTWENIDHKVINCNPKDLECMAKIKYTNVRMLTVDLAIVMGAVPKLLEYFGKKFPNLEKLVLIAPWKWSYCTWIKNSEIRQYWCKTMAWPRVPKSVQRISVFGSNIWEHRPSGV